MSREPVISSVAGGCVSHSAIVNWHEHRESVLYPFAFLVGVRSSCTIFVLLLSWWTTIFSIFSPVLQGSLLTFLFMLPIRGQDEIDDCVRLAQSIQTVFHGIKHNRVPACKKCCWGLHRLVVYVSFAAGLEQMKWNMPCKWMQFTVRPINGRLYLRYAYIHQAWDWQSSSD